MNKYREAFDRWRDFNDKFKDFNPDDYDNDEILDTLEKAYSLFHDAFYIAEITDVLFGDGWFDKFSQLIEKGEENEN